MKGSSFRSCFAVSALQWSAASQGLLHHTRLCNNRRRLWSLPAIRASRESPRIYLNAVEPDAQTEANRTRQGEKRGLAKGYHSELSIDAEKEMEFSVAVRRFGFVLLYSIIFCSLLLFVDFLVATVVLTVSCLYALSLLYFPRLNVLHVAIQLRIIKVVRKEIVRARKHVLLQRQRFISYVQTMRGRD